MLGKNGLLIELIVQRVGKEVTAGCEVTCSGDGAVANNSVLGGRGRRQRQACSSDGHRAGSVGVDGHRVVGGQRQQRVVFVDRNVSIGQDLKRE